MHRFTLLTPIDDQGVAADQMMVDLGEVLWMESRRVGTALYIDDPTQGSALITCSITVRETPQEILALAMTDDGGNDYPRIR